MTRWSAITRTRGRRSALAYGSRSTTAAEDNLNRLGTPRAGTLLRRARYRPCSIRFSDGLPNDDRCCVQQASSVGVCSALAAPIDPLWSLATQTDEKARTHEEGLVVYRGGEAVGRAWRDLAPTIHERFCERLTDATFGSDGCRAEYVRAGGLTAAVRADEVCCGGAARARSGFTATTRIRRPNVRSLGP